ncbi:MAG: paraquat-inducible protein [Pseudomonadota bacterium]|jgi:paraquat-inducible protein A
MSLRTSYAARHPAVGLAVNGLLLLAFGLLLLGLWAPLLTLEKFYVFSNTVSLWSALVQLAAEGEWGLLLLVGVFSVVFPMAKLLLLLAIWNLEAATTARHRQHLKWLAAYSKWSMLDVFVVALLVVSVKLGALAQARVEYGIYVFAASVVLTMLIAAWIGRNTE